VEEEEGGRHSGPVLRFVNAVADEIAKTDPGKLIDTLAYWYTEDPPAKVRPRPNVRIRLCPIGVCEAHPYERCPRSAYFVRNLKAWSAITNQLYIWHYNTNFSHYLAPFPDFDEFAADIPLYHRNGVVGLFLQGGYAPGGGAENSELRAYVMARLLWNPAVDVQHEIDDFLGAVYGAAAKPMRRYLDRLHREVRLPPEGEGQHIWIFNLPDFGQPFLGEANTLLRQAIEQAKDPAVRRRVERASLPLEYVELVQAEEYHLHKDTYAPVDLAGWQRRFHEFAAKLRTFGIQSIREGRTLDQDENTVDAMRAYPAFTLLNEAWRVVVVPDLGGRIVSMVANERGGVDLLRKPKPGEGGYPGTGGQMVQAFPDFPLRAWDIEWHATPYAGGTEILLEGSCTNGLQLSRRIRLDAGWVRTEVTARNSSHEPIDVVLQARADFDPGNIDSARVQFVSRAGESVDRPVLTAGEQPNGSETRKNGNVPRGEWTLHRAKAPPVLNRFAAELAERTTLSWTAKGGPRVTFGIWSKRRRLAPGETIRLEADYR
jgi:hypothetical protein